MVKRVFYGAVANDNVRALQDINSREFTIMAILAIAVLVLGLWPAPVIDVMHASVENLLQHISVSKL
jgi:NADH-quinone oxidoreductase subunit M